MKRIISGIYERIDGNIYATRQVRSSKRKPAPCTVYSPVATQMGGVEFTGLRVAKVIKSPRIKRLDKEQRKWYAALSK